MEEGSMISCCADVSDRGDGEHSLSCLCGSGEHPLSCEAAVVIAVHIFCIYILNS